MSGTGNFGNVGKLRSGEIALAEDRGLDAYDENRRDESLKVPTKKKKANHKNKRRLLPFIEHAQPQERLRANLASTFQKKIPAGSQSMWRT